MVTKKGLVDVNPQFLRQRVVESAANTYTEAEINMPVVQNYEGDYAMVLELLKVIAYLTQPDLVNAVNTLVAAHLSDKVNTAVVLPHDASCICPFERDTRCLDTSGGTDATITAVGAPNPIVIDFTDSNGNGILYGKQKLYLGIKGTNNSAAKQLSVMILYRMKKVKASELIGIIQN